MPLVGELTKLERGRELLERDREYHRRHLVADHAANTRRERLRAPDREPIPALKRGREKRYALDVIPVGVGQEDVTRDGCPVRVGDERGPELTNARAGIEQDKRARRRTHFDGGRVSAIPDRRWPGAGNGPARAPEPQLKRHYRR